ncbi:hypothetical protein [Hydrogenophaga sp.]|uniref:hypothetical protein n=1 Tax=Hydrogenophaga sp. TaxID=1904254 RepID=UPI002722C83C|nr:hypothetical protein [Hydrogenophaga sp.]MDO9439087.1 hypothetical protein [Hydrogenophaga sp.]
MFQRIAILVLSIAATGCASVMNETTHPMKVETRTEAGQLVTGAECKLSNDRGSFSVKSGDTTQIRRSNTDVDIVCNHPQNKVASGRAISRANAGMFGNIIIGGGIGAIIDHNQGTAYTYPTWVQLVYGKSLVFDRSNQKEDQPTPGTDTGLAPLPNAAAPTAAASGAAPPQAGSRVTMDDLRGLLPPQP